MSCIARSRKMMTVDEKYLHPRFKAHSSEAEIKKLMCTWTICNVMWRSVCFILKWIREKLSVKFFAMCKRTESDNAIQFHGGFNFIAKLNLCCVSWEKWSRQDELLRAIPLLCVHHHFVRRQRPRARDTQPQTFSQRFGESIPALVDTLSDWRNKIFTNCNVGCDFYI